MIIATNLSAAAAAAAEGVFAATKRLLGSRG